MGVLSISKFAGAGANIAGSAKNWGNTDQIYATDDSGSSVTLVNNTSPDDRSDYLSATNFGFAIPAHAVIKGISVSIFKKHARLNDAVDLSAVLTKNGSVSVGDDKKKAGTWQNTYNQYIYGTSTTDLWGATWTPAEINASTFGFMLSVVRTEVSTNSPSASVDSVEVTVYYTIPSNDGFFMVM